MEGGVKGAALTTGSQSLDSTSAKAPVLQTLPSSGEVATNARRWGESFSPAPQVRDGLGERPVMYGLGSARAPDLPVTTFFFLAMVWYSIEIYIKNKTLSRARAPEILRAVHPKVGIHQRTRFGASCFFLFLNGMVHNLCEKNKK